MPSSTSSGPPEPSEALIARARAAGYPDGPRADPDRAYKPPLPEWALRTDRHVVDAIVLAVLAANGDTASPDEPAEHTPADHAPVDITPVELKPAGRTPVDLQPVDSAVRDTG